MLWNACLPDGQYTLEAYSKLNSNGWNGGFIMIWDVVHGRMILPPWEGGLAFTSGDTYRYGPFDLNQGVFSQCAPTCKTGAACVSRGTKAGTLVGVVERATGVRDGDAYRGRDGVSDPYVHLRIGERHETWDQMEKAHRPQVRTRVVQDSASPRWDRKFAAAIDDLHDPVMIVRLYDSDGHVHMAAADASDDLLGQQTVDLRVDSKRYNPDTVRPTRRPTNFPSTRAPRTRRPTPWPSRWPTGAPTTFPTPLPEGQCFRRGRCDAGYMDKTDGNMAGGEIGWACGVGFSRAARRGPSERARPRA